MLDLGLKHSDFLKLKALLVGPHRIYIRLEIMDLSHKHQRDVSEMLLGGQVNIDANGDETTRTADLELLDPMGQLSIEGKSPKDGSLYMTRMIRITYVVKIGRAHV